MKQSYLEVWSCFLNLLNSFISHTSYVLSAQKNHLSEMVLFSTHNMCCGLVEGKMNYFMQPYLEVWLMFTQFTLGLNKHHMCGCSQELL